MGERAQLIFDKSFAQLAREFNFQTRVNAVSIPSSLYQEFVTLYKRSEALHDKLSTVLNDGEHVLIMEEGRDFFRLPPSRYLDKELVALKSALISFDPYKVQHQSNGTVRLRDTQVQGFFDLFSRDYDVVHKLFEAFRHTDYLKYHKYLRDERQVKYAGPNSLQEILNVFFGLARAQNRQRAYLRELSAAAPL